MSRFALVLMLSLVCGSGHAASAPEPVIPTPGADFIPLAGHIAVLRDESGKLALDDLRSPPLAERFTTSAHSRFNRGLSKDTFWHRFRLRGPQTPDGDSSIWIIEQGFPTLDYLDLYIERPDGKVETILTGDLRRQPEAQIPFRRFAFPLRLAPAEEVAVYVRSRTTGRHQVRLGVWSARAYVSEIARENRRAGMVQGTFLVMLVFNLLIYLVIRDRAYLYCVLFIALMIAFSLTNSGDARQFANNLFDGAPALINDGNVLLPVLLMVMLLLFGREFLSTREHVPRVHGLTNWMLGLSTALLLLYPATGFVITIRLLVPIFLASVLILLGASIYLSVKGVRAAKFYLLSWSIFFLANAFFALNAFGGPALTVFTTFAIPATFCIALALLSLALADRINTERREAAAASERANRLRGFLPQKVADLVGGGDQALLEPKRRNVTVCVIDLRGFTPFSETSAPEDVMAVLREFYDTMGKVVEAHGGTVEHFAGDSMLIFFNAPLEIPEPEKQAIETALEMRSAFEPLRQKWLKQGHELGLGVGIADGYATIGAIGFSGRSQYAAIGAVTNLASRLCSQAQHGEILTTTRVLEAVGSIVESESAGQHNIKGFSKPIEVLRVRELSTGTAISRGPL